MSDLLVNSENDRVHLIDPWGEVTLCGKFSAWKTANPQYARSTRTYYPELKIYDRDRSKYEVSCKTCRSRMDNTICRQCKRVWNPRPIFDKSEGVEQMCHACDSTESVTL